MPRLHQNMLINEKFKDDYKANSLLRKKFREEKKDIEKKGILFGDSDDKVKLRELDSYDMVEFCYILRVSLTSKGTRPMLLS